MLLEIAVGDAYGAGFEYVNPYLIRQFNDLARYVRHPRHGAKPGCYTDDTQMSLAIAEAIVSNDPWTPQALAARFVTAFKRDPREGYAQRFHGFLKHVKDADQFLAQIQPASDKSGAAMRAGPIGIFSTIDEVIEKATIQARITHDTPNGIGAAVTAALMTHYCLYQLGPKAGLGKFLEAHVPGAWSEPWRGKVRSKGWMSVRAAVTALARAESLSGLLKDCVDFSGDVDTVAAIALSAASCCGEIAQDLPAHLIDTLENGAFGRDYIVNLDRQLMARGPIH